MAERYRIVLAKRASDNLQAIFLWIAKDSPGNASRMVERILDAIDSLKLFPHRTVVEGQSTNTKHPVRSLSIPPYSVLFRVIDENHVVRILRVRHGARRRPRRLD